MSLWALSNLGLGDSVVKKYVSGKSITILLSSQLGLDRIHFGPDTWYPANYLCQVSGLTTGYCGSKKSCWKIQKLKYNYSQSVCMYVHPNFHMYVRLEKLALWVWNNETRKITEEVAWLWSRHIATWRLPVQSARTTFPATLKASENMKYPRTRRNNQIFMLYRLLYFTLVT